MAIEDMQSDNTQQTSSCAASASDPTNANDASSAMSAADPACAGIGNTDLVDEEMLPPCDPCSQCAQHLPLHIPQPKHLSLVPLAILTFYNVSGGPFGIEASVRAGGNFFPFSGF